MEHEISVHDLKQHLDSQPTSSAPGADAARPTVLLDVREPWESSMGVIEGACLMPMGDVPSNAHRQLDPDSHIVVYCHHGARSLSVAMWLREQGFSKAQSLRGGIDAWSRQIDPSIPRY